MIYILLGMHKSGTTLLSQILHESGIDMGRFTEKGYDDGNKFERRETHDLNIEILGQDSKEHSLKISDAFTGDTSPALAAKLKQFIAVNSGRRDWGFKDPRTCLTYGLWRKVIPEHGLIAVFRHPSELWNHYRRQKSHQVPLYFWICWRAVRAWYVYNHEILKILKARGKDYFLTEYNDFMEGNDGLRRLSEYVRRPLKDSRNRGLYRSKKMKFDPIFSVTVRLQKGLYSRDVMGLYDELKALAA